MNKIFLTFFVLCAYLLVTDLTFAQSTPNGSRVSGGSAEPEFIMPIQKSDALNQEIGFWPFGVKGGEHPEGHPGFDFEARVGAPIYAVGDGSVGFVGPSGHHGGMTISIGHMTGSEPLDTFYTGSITNIRVKKGSAVKQGDVIADFDSAEPLGMPSGISTFHFGVAKQISRDRREEVCPADYFSAKAKKEVEALHRASKYQERNTFPLLCNPCPPSGCR